LEGQDFENQNIPEGQSADDEKIRDQPVETPEPERNANANDEQTPEPERIFTLSALDWRGEPDRTSGNEGVPLQ
jgi:hypothetical protein